MEYMEQQMQNYIEADISEADKCYARIAELEEQNAALAAQVEAFGDKLSEVVALLDVDGMTAVQWLLDNCQEIESLTNMEPEQHLAEIRAQAVMDAIKNGFTPEQFHALKESRDGIESRARAAIKGWWACWEWVDSDDRDKLTLIPAADQYAENIRQEKK